MTGKGKNLRHYLLATLAVVLILFVDQLLKFWIKTNMTLGEELPVFGDWFILHFTENDGMAFGLKLGGVTGKFVLTFFRIVAVIAITYYLISQIIKGISMVLVVLIACILAGAIGNILDSVFYGRFFTESTFLTHAVWAPETGGYSGWFRGKVVDMLYFPIIEAHYPEWVPKLGGRSFIFFRPVFNIADAAISVGVFSILLFQRQAFMPEKKEETTNVEGSKIVEETAESTEETAPEESTPPATDSDSDPTPKQEN